MENLVQETNMAAADMLGTQQEGSVSWGASPIYLQVGQGPSSGNTVSNFDVGSARDMGSETWYAKKSELTQKFQRARECEKVLKAQLYAQHEHIKLELQECKNQHLESELAHREMKRSAQERKQKRLDDLNAEKYRLEEAAKIREHEFEVQQERCKAQFREKQQQLEHDIQMRELELEQQAREYELQQKLVKVNASKGRRDNGRDQGGQGLPTLCVLLWAASINSRLPFPWQLSPQGYAS